MNILDLSAPPRVPMLQLLGEYAPLQPVPLCPELRAHYAHALVDVWEAAERLAGSTLPAPFWAYPWAGGIALSRLLLDQPQIARGKRVLDFGAGGGVVALAAARAGAARVVANDIDATALLVCSIAAEAQDLRVETLHADLCAEPERVDEFELVVCSDLFYEKQETPRQHGVLARARAAGADVLVADAGRTYFDGAALVQLAELEVPVPADLEGGATRVARVFRNIRADERPAALPLS